MLGSTRKQIYTFLVILFPVLAWNAAVALTSTPHIQERIVIAPSEVLRRKTAPISPDETEIVQLLIDMAEYVDESFPPKTGLALPQVGVSKRGYVAIINGEPEVIINPVVKVYGQQQPSFEGCVSLPGTYGYVPRNEQLTVEYYDEDWKKQRRQLTNLSAFIIQHEHDHINGILITDKLLPEKETEVDKSNIPLE